RKFEIQGRREGKRGLLLNTANPGPFTRWRIARLRRAAGALGNINRFDGKLADRLNRQVADTVECLKLNRRYLLQEALRRHRRTFQAFSKGVRARTSLRQETYFEEVRWDALLEALPVWLVNLSDLHRV